MSTEISAMEWRLAKDKLVLERGSTANKMLHLPHEKPNGLSYLPTSDYLEHTFIQFEDKPYAMLPDIVGKGQFGEVKFMLSEGNTRYAVKMQKGEMDDPKSVYFHTEQELKIGKDVGLILEDGAERDGKKETKYFLMPDLGKSLDKYLVKRISIEDGLDLSIKLCTQVSRHHMGLATHSGKKVFHRDIKPANIMFNPATKEVKLADYGVSKFADLKSYPAYIVGTPYYLPYRGVTLHTNEALDDLALKRTIYMPGTLYVNGHGFCSVPLGVPRLLSTSAIESLGLKRYFDTSQQTTVHHTALHQGALLILAKANQKNRYSAVGSNIELQKSLYVLYYADLLDKNHIDKLFDEQVLRKKGANLWPIIHKIPQSYLKQSFSDNGVYHLLKDLQTLNAAAKSKAFELIKQTEVDRLADNSSLNQLRLEIGLAEYKLEPVLAKPSPSADVVLPNIFQPQKPKVAKELGFVRQYPNNFFPDIAPKKVSPQLPKIDTASMLLEIQSKVIEVKLKMDKETVGVKRYPTTHQMHFIDYSAMNERVQRTNFISNIVTAKSLSSATNFIRARLLYQNRGDALVFNKELLTGLKEIVNKYEKTYFPTNYELAVGQVLSWLRKNSEDFSAQKQYAIQL